MRVFIRTSGWSIWAARIARPVLPLVVLAIAFHYIGVISGVVFIACILLAVSLALVALILGLIGYFSLWYSGDTGWRQSTSGVMVGLLAMLFITFVAVSAGQYPNINDVSTAPKITPIWLGQDGANSPVSTAVDQQSFRSAITRQYRLDQQTAQELVTQAVIKMGWRKVGQSQTSDAELHQYYEAKTWLGFVDDVTVSTRETAQLFIVNVRSASRIGDSDLGANSTRIENFLLILDELVASIPESEITD